MPVKIPDNLPARQILEAEHISVIPEQRAFAQDIRPLKIGIVNLMPRKSVAETQLLRLLGNSPLQIAVTLLRLSSHESKNTPEEYLARFYRDFADSRDERFDGLIITGAPVETMDFADVTYWPELQELMRWSTSHVYSAMHICWGAQAGLFHHYGIEKHLLPDKAFGVFDHIVVEPNHPLMRGFDEVFRAPHSRHTDVHRDDILAQKTLRILAESKTVGVYAVAGHGVRQVFLTGHPEYDRETLGEEYQRDCGRGLPIAIPVQYYPENDPAQTPQVTWRSHAQLLFTNWLTNIYEETPYDLRDLTPLR